MPPVNPEILRWARETAGLTLEDASHKLGIQIARGVSPVDRLNALETGDVEPTRPLLLKMAKQYHRPLIVFYMEKPPRKGNRGQDFRTLPDSTTKVANALVDALIRDVQVRQSILRAALEDEEDIQALPYIGSMNISDGVDSLVESIRRTIGFDLDTFRRQPTSEDAFKYLRAKAEDAGVFVLLIGDLGSHHTAFDLEVFRGFALSDEIAPFVVINDRDSRAAWSFTLVHELTHIWLGQTGISNAYSDLDIERFCNKVASDVLLPETDLASLDLRYIFDFEEMTSAISEFASDRNLSSSMVAYNLYLLGKIDRSSWVRLHNEYRRLWLEAYKARKEKRQDKKGGPSYYVVRRHRLGDNLVVLVHQMILGGTLTTSKASKILGVTPKNVQNLIEPVIQSRSG